LVLIEGKPFDFGGHVSFIKNKQIPHVISSESEGERKA
jgi:hypothetical protein